MIGIFPIISITANNTIKAVKISLKLKFMSLKIFYKIRQLSLPKRKVIEKNKQFIESMIGLKLDIKILNNMLLRKEIIKNSKLKKSKYDIICFDMPWTGELHQNKYLTPLNDIINSTNFNLKDFHPAGVKASTFNHKLLGLPIEEVASIMVYRSDIFKKLNLKIPKNISEFFLNLKIISESKIIKYQF